MLKLKLSPVAEVGGSAASDPFAEDVSQVKIEMPLLKPKLYRFEIANVAVVPTKETKELPESDQVLMLTFDLKTTQPEKALKKGSDGKDIIINPGYPVKHRVMITETEKITVDQIKRGLAEVLQAVYPNKGKGHTARELMTSPEALEGKVVDANVIVEEASKGFPAKNVVKMGGFVPMA